MLLAYASRARRALGSLDRAPVCDVYSLCAASTRRYYTHHPSITPQLTGASAPKPSATSNEDPLINGRMRTFPSQHPSLGSVKNAVATGCPAIVHSQMSSDLWKSTHQATICNREQTAGKRPEGKRMAPALYGTGELYVEPVECYVAPAGAPPTIYVSARTRMRSRTNVGSSVFSLAPFLAPAFTVAERVCSIRLLSPTQRDQRVYKHMGTLTRAGAF